MYTFVRGMRLPSYTLQPGQRTGALNFAARCRLVPKLFCQILNGTATKMVVLRVSIIYESTKGNSYEDGGTKNSYNLLKTLNLILTLNRAQSG